MAIEGLAGILKYKAEQKAKEEARNRPKAEYLSSVWPETPRNKSGLGDSLVFQFIQELDKGAPNYDPEKGIGLLLKEHEPPGAKGFTRRANCTDPECEDPNDCYGCLRKSAEYVKDDKVHGNWKTKTNLYINIATLIDGKPKVFVLSRNADSGFFDQILEELSEEGTLLGKAYKVTKSGTGTQTAWNLRASKEEMFDISDLEAFDLHETVERDIPLEEQPKYYGAVWSGRGNAVTSDDSGSASKVDDGDEW